MVTCPAPGQAGPFRLNSRSLLTNIGQNITSTFRLNMSACYSSPSSSRAGQVAAAGPLTFGPTLQVSGVATSASPAHQPAPPRPGGSHLASSQRSAGRQAARRAVPDPALPRRAAPYHRCHAAGPYGAVGSAHLAQDARRGPVSTCHLNGQAYDAARCPCRRGLVDVGRAVPFTPHQPTSIENESISRNDASKSTNRISSDFDISAERLPCGAQRLVVLGVHREEALDGSGVVARRRPLDRVRDWRLIAG
jgi:hypothetical protein